MKETNTTETSKMSIIKIERCNDRKFNRARNESKWSAGFESVNAVALEQFRKSMIEYGFGTVDKKIYQTKDDGVWFFFFEDAKRGRLKRHFLAVMQQLIGDFESRFTWSNQ
jgi:hypothetical protein